MDGVDATTHIDQLEEHGIALADAADRAGLGAPVPTCSDWDVRALLGHVGMVHRWATVHVREGAAAFADDGPDLGAPADGVVEWFRAGHAGIVAALRAAPDDLDAMTFLADAGRPRAFWARRQAHETAIHRVDAEAAGGTRPAFDRDFALDGIAELLEGFLARRGGKLLADPPLTLRVAPTDADTTWLVEVRADGRTITRDGAEPADCTLSGSCAELYLDLWNRGGDTTVSGDPRAIEVWRSLARVTWS